MNITINIPDHEYIAAQMKGDYKKAFFDICRDLKCYELDDHPDLACLANNNMEIMFMIDMSGRTIWVSCDAWSTVLNSFDDITTQEILDQRILDLCMEYFFLRDMSLGSSSVEGMWTTDSMRRALRVSHRIDFYNGRPIVVTVDRWHLQRST